MELPLKVKTEPHAELLTIDEVFLYKITNKEHQLTRHAHKASTWTVNDPDWRGKLKLIAEGPKRCQVLFESRNKGTFFGETVITKYPSPHAFQKVIDSTRYFTLKIRNTLSPIGEDILYGIGFMSRTASSSVTEALESYFTNPVKEEIKPKDGAIKIKVETEEDAPAVQVPEEVPKEKSLQLQYNCSVCGTSCSTTELLKQHVEAAHTDEARSILLYCDSPDCGKRFLSELTLDGHKVTAHNEAPKRRKIYCEKDEKEAVQNSVKFSSSSGSDAAGSSDHNQVAQSETIPTKKSSSGCSYREKGTRLLLCHRCPNSSFSTYEKPTLLKHWKLMHKIQNPDLCHLCCLIFGSKENCVDHVNKEHFPCKPCNAVFRYEKTLKKHLKRVHNVELSVAGESVEPVTIMTKTQRKKMQRKQFRSPSGVPYQEKETRIFFCHRCPKSCFSTYDTPTLHKHWKSIHKIRTTFLCELCCLIFSSENYRSEHMDKEHFPSKPCSAVSQAGS